MADKIEIMNLVQVKQFLEQELKSLICGSIEIREKNNKRYIYTHYRDDGQLITKYVGEYTDDLYNQIISNNFAAKELRKQIKTIQKELKKLNYNDSELSPNVILNIDFAKKHLVETIYKQAILEGVAITLSDTESIIEGGKAGNLTSEDIMKVINLKHAWEFILNKNVISSKTNYALLCEINKLILEGFYYSAGHIRKLPVKIGGTKWIPNIPSESDIKEELNNLLNTKCSYIDMAIKLVLFVTKKQLFIDGNKRTSIIYANHYLVSHGKGLLVIPDNLVDEYKDLLVKYYEDNKSDKITKFLKEKCYINIKEDFNED